MNLTFFYPSLSPHRHLLEELGVAGMSSDEEGDEDDQTTDQGRDNIPAIKQYFIRVPQWRSEVVTAWLRVFDVLYLRARADGVFGDQRGAFPHARCITREKSTNPRFVSRLPENAYDERWLRTLVDPQVVLRPRPSVVYYHTPQTLQYDFTSSMTIYLLIPLQACIRYKGVAGGCICITTQWSWCLSPIIPVHFSSRLVCACETLQQRFASYYWGLSIVFTCNQNQSLIITPAKNTWTRAMGRQVLCTCKSYCLRFNQETMSYEGPGILVPKTTADRHRLADLSTRELDKTASTSAARILGQPPPTNPPPMDLVEGSSRDVPQHETFHLEMEVASRCMWTPSGRPFVFVVTPTEQLEYQHPDLSRGHLPNHGPYSLVPGDKANREFLENESRLCEILYHLEQYLLRDAEIVLQDKAYEGLHRMQRYKEAEWNRQRKLSIIRSLGCAVVDSGMSHTIVPVYLVLKTDKLPTSSKQFLATQSSLLPF